MKFNVSLIFLISFYYSFQAVGLEITLNQPPGDYRVYNLDGKGLKRTASTKDFKKFKFQIPNKFIVKNSNGDLNLSASLNRWRRETPVAHGNPRTQNGIGFFPFTDESGVPRYIALNHIVKRYGDKADFNFDGYRSPRSQQVSTVGQTVSRPTVKKPIAAQPQVTKQTPTKSPIKANVDASAVTADSGYTDKSTFEPVPAISKVPVPSVNPKKSTVISEQPEETFNLNPTETARRERLERNAIPRSTLKQAAAQLDQNKKPAQKTYNISSELGGGDQFDTLPAEYATPGIFNEQFPPRKAKFSGSPAKARSFNNPEWAKKNETQKANYLNKKYKQLLRAHGLQGIYPSGVLVCKAYKESTFNPNVKNRISSAAGISQVLTGTAKDLFSRGRWFRSKVNGFTHLRNGRDFHYKMSRSMLAQMEIGLAVLHQKKRDYGGGVRTILQNYYGSRSKSENKRYANSILNCYSCAQKNGFTKKCLKKAR